VPDKLGEPGIEALRKEREVRKQLEADLKALQAQLKSGDVLAFELQEARSQAAKLERDKQKEVDTLRIEIEKRDRLLQENQLNQVFRAAAAQYNLSPKFTEVLLAANRSQFQLSPDGDKVGTADGKTLADWFESQREDKPEIFLAPTPQGTGGISSNGSGRKSRLISRNDSASFLQNLDAIAKGDIVTGD
jgi:hypothetical protein